MIIQLKQDRRRCLLLIMAKAKSKKITIEVKDITFIDGTVYKTKDKESIYDAIFLPEWDEIKEDKRKFAESFYKQYCNTDPFSLPTRNRTLRMVFVLSLPLCLMI